LSEKQAELWKLIIKPVLHGFKLGKSKVYYKTLWMNTGDMWLVPHMLMFRVNSYELNKILL